MHTSYTDALMHTHIDQLAGAVEYTDYIFAGR